ncbi:MAG: hypothetical protein EOM12_11805 [Verrucomicrobiae bacterium]|nr:hypothetical protein [Verrucomicrobiae bacterium]
MSNNVITPESLIAKYLPIRDSRDPLRDALQALYDEQNGPPLEQRYREAWEAAMEKARKVLEEVEEIT